MGAMLLFSEKVWVWFGFSHFTTVTAFRRGSVEGKKKHKPNLLDVFCFWCGVGRVVADNASILWRCLFTAVSVLKIRAFPHVCDFLDYLKRDSFT